VTEEGYRVDPRGNRDGVDAQFIPPQEQLAFEIKSPQEVNFIGVLAEPLPVVLQVLEQCKTWEEVLLSVPDMSLESALLSGLTHPPIV
jgi:hypothetical protein